MMRLYKNIPPAVQGGLIFFCGMICGGGLLFLAGWFWGGGCLIREEKSPLPYEKAIQLFPERASALGWSVRTVPCGLPVPVPGQRITVFEICSREYASAILTEESSRKCAGILPCKIAIYEKGSRVWISRLNGSLTAFLLGGRYADIFIRNILPEQDLMLSDLLAAEQFPPKKK